MPEAPDLELAEGERLEIPVPGEHPRAAALMPFVQQRAITREDLLHFHALTRHFTNARQANPSFNVPDMDLASALLGHTLQTIALSNLTVAKGAQLVLRSPANHLVAK